MTINLDELENKVKLQKEYLELLSYKIAGGNDHIIIHQLFLTLDKILSLIQYIGEKDVKS